MTEKKKHNNKADPNKLELANRIANQSKKVATTYAHVEDTLFRVVRWFSTWIEKILFNQRFGMIVALGLAILLYASVNYSNENSLFGSALTNSREVSGVAVTAKYNSETFEISGLPTTANIVITGDGSSVNTAASQKGTVVANLEGLTEGTHEVRLTTEGFGDNVNIVVNPSNITVTLKKKTTRQFDVSFDFINTDKMDSTLSLGTPEFEYSKINVRASKDTLDSIAFVKALIDVNGVTADFSQEATLVAYDKNGQPVNADIVPSSITVNVTVSSPNKTVPIVVETTGEVPDNMAIESITMDNESVTIYASESVLSKIDSVTVTVDASTLTKDSTMVRPVSLPSGVKASSISQVNMDVKLGEGVTRTVTEVPINYKNNTNKYKIETENSQSTVTVNVFGTQANVDAIDPNEIYVYFDMANVSPGGQDVQLYVEQPSGALVKYSLSQATLTINVLSDEETTEENTGGTTD